MRGYGSCASGCLDWQSSAPVQGSPSHHWTQWHVVSSGSPCLSLLDLKWFPVGPCTPRGEGEPDTPL